MPDIRVYFATTRFEIFTKETGEKAFALVRKMVVKLGRKVESWAVVDKAGKQVSSHPTVRAARDAALKLHKEAAVVMASQYRASTKEGLAYTIDAAVFTIDGDEFPGFQVKDASGRAIKGAEFGNYKTARSFCESAIQEGANKKQAVS